MRKLAVPAALALMMGSAVGPPAASHEASTPSAAGTDAPDARFLYVANVGSHDISQYRIKAGALTPLSPASVPGGKAPLQMAASPDGGTVYVSNFLLEGTVSQYGVEANGALEPKSPPTVDAGAFPRHVVVRPNGANVYVINFGDIDFGDNGVSQYDVGRGGKLTPKDPATVPAGKRPRGLSVSGDGRSLYVSNFGDPLDPEDDTISQYDISADGALTPKDPPTVLAGDRPRGNAVSPDGESFYVANAGRDSISQYDVDAAGRLTPKTPATVAAGNGPTSIAVTPDGASAYVTNQRGGNLSQYNIDPGGRLTRKDPATVPGGFGPTLVTITPDGNYVYVANEGSDDVSQYGVGLGGLLAPLVPPTVPAGDSPVGLALARR